MNTCDADSRKTRYEAKYLSCSGNRFTKERSKLNYYFNCQQNISRNNEYRDIIKINYHCVNSYY